MKLVDKLFLSIGAMKAGTTWLFTNLRKHPALSATPIKEVHYFYDKHGSARTLTLPQRLETAKRLLAPQLLKFPDALMDLIDWYKAYLSDPVDDVWFASLFKRRHEPMCYCCEFSNLNFTLPENGWTHVKAISASHKILLTLRDPLDRLWSHVRFHENLVGRFDDLTAMTVSDFGRVIDEGDYYRHATYARTISQLRRSFGEDDVMLQIYEHATRDPLATFRGIESFLRIPNHSYDETIAARIFNPSKTQTMPAAFVEAVKPFLATEYEALSRISFPIPREWVLPD